MGLFDKKTCVFCGKESGLIGGLMGETLAGGEYMCGECRRKCTSDDLRFSAMTVADVKANMAVAEANKKKGTTEFKASQRIKKGAYRDKDFLDIDAGHGWFMNADEKDGWVYNLGDVYYFNLDLDYLPLEGGSFEIRTEDYPELPKVPQGVKVDDARLVIWMKNNELGVDKVTIKAAGYSPDESDIRGAFAAAHDFFLALKDYRMSQIPTGKH